MKCRLAWLSVAMVSGSLLALVGSTALHLEIPEPTGEQAVGRASYLWVDETREEAHTVGVDDRRSVPVELWYPSVPGTGEPAPYIANLEQISSGLVASGEFGAIDVWGLGMVRDNALAGAALSDEASTYPVILLSPGNATNVGFYASLAEELASHGYVVVGIDHPYQVAATVTAHGVVAVYDQSADLVPLDQRESMTAAKIAERVDDLEYVIRRLNGGEEGDLFAGRLDLTRLAVMGHSNGGVAAVEACRSLPELRACLNIDGQLAGGPFSVDPAGIAPDQPFMYLTKETNQHPEIVARFDESPEAYLVSVPAATHESFTDGALLGPTFHPLTRSSDRIMDTTRGMIEAFFANTLGDQPLTVLGEVAASTDLYVNVFPLRGQPLLPDV
jgi:dienelactone hydrolase